MNETQGTELFFLKHSNPLTRLSSFLFLTPHAQKKNN